MCVHCKFKFWPNVIPEDSYIATDMNNIHII